MLSRGHTARDVMTREAFENAIAVVMAFGGSTNAVLHLLAIAREAGVDLVLDDFNRIGDKVPHLADVKPFGRHMMTTVDKVGGVPVVMRALLDAGLLHGDALTVTGRTVAENLDALAPGPLDGDILRPLSNPIHPTGGLTILRGSLAPDGAVVKSAGFDTASFEGTARVFDGEQGAMDAVSNNDLNPGDVVVIRDEGPRGGPGMREMLAVTGAIKGAGLGKDVLLLTDGRFSGGTTGPLRRARRPRGRARRADRVRARGRPHPPRPHGPHPRPAGPTRSCPSGRPAGPRRRPSTAPASSASTPASSARRPRAPSWALTERARFDDLTPRDLYDLLALRVRVFVVEQECAFQELDGLDAEAEHVWTRGPAGEVVAYLRVLKDGERRGSGASSPRPSTGGRAPGRR